MIIPETKSYTLVSSLPELKEVQPMEGAIVIDTETTGLEYRSCKLVSIILGLPDGKAVIIDMRAFHNDWRDTYYWKQEIARILNIGEDTLYAGHNLKFDALFLKHHLGVEFVRVYDTCLIERLLTNGKQLPCGLLDCVLRRHIPVEMEKVSQKWFIELDQRSAWHEPFPEQQLKYMENDVLAPRLLVRAQESEIRQTHVKTAVNLENGALLGIVAMEYHGMLIDVTRWKTIVEHHKANHARLTQSLQNTLGAAYRRVYARQYSTKIGGGLLGQDALEKFVLSQTNATLNLASDQQVLSGLRELGIMLENVQAKSLYEYRDNPVVKELLQWKKLQKLVSTYGETILKKVGEDRRLRCTFTQLSDHHNGKREFGERNGGAESGRIIASSPNVQQIPRPEEGKDDTDYRRCFIAPPGHRLLVADLSNIEMRVLAEVSGDENMLAAYERGEDLHSATARIMFQLDKDTNPKKHMVNGVSARSAAKAINFGLAYGKGPASLGLELGVTTEVAIEMIEAHSNAYPKVKKYLDDAGRGGLRNRYITSLSGRRRYYSKDTLMADWQIVNASKNMPMQGTNADIIKLAIILLHRELPKDCHIVMAVHDELILEVPDAHVDIAKELLAVSMRQACVTFLKKVTIPETEVLVADHWIKG